MKSTLTFIAALSLASSAFADLTRDQMRLKIANTVEVKSLSDAYKKQGYKCQNTEILSATSDQIQARKTCIKRGPVEGARIMEIEAFIVDDVSEASVTKINFVTAG